MSKPSASGIFYTIAKRHGAVFLYGGPFKTFEEAKKFGDSSSYKCVVVKETQSA